MVFLGIIKYGVPQYSAFNRNLIILLMLLISQVTFAAPNLMYLQLIAIEPKLQISLIRYLYKNWPLKSTYTVNLSSHLRFWEQPSQLLTRVCDIIIQAAQPDLTIYYSERTDYRGSHPCDRSYEHVNFAPIFSLWYLIFIGARSNLIGFVAKIGSKWTYL